MMGSFNQYCGIDVGKATLDYCLRSSEKHHEMLQDQLNNDLNSIAEVFSDPKFDGTLFVLEYTGNYSSRLLYQLSQMERSVSVVSPLQSKSFMSALGLTNKTDKQAAHIFDGSTYVHATVQSTIGGDAKTKTTTRNLKGIGKTAAHAGKPIACLGSITYPGATS